MNTMVCSDQELVGFRVFRRVFRHATVFSGETPVKTATVSSEVQLGFCKVLGFVTYLYHLRPVKDVAQFTWFVDFSGKRVAKNYLNYS